MTCYKLKPITKSIGSYFAVAKLASFPDVSLEGNIDFELSRYQSFLDLFAQYFDGGLST